MTSPYRGVIRIEADDEVEEYGVDLAEYIAGRGGSGVGEMGMSQREEWADDHGYQKGSCPRCHRTCWSDTGRFECSHCGLDSGGDEPESDKDDESEEEEADEDDLSVG